MNKLKIYNGTGAAITIIVNAILDAQLVKFVGGSAFVVIPQQKELLAVGDDEELEPLNGIPVNQPYPTDIDDLPEGYDAYIVSNAYGRAYKVTSSDCSKLYTLGYPVYSPNGEHILGYYNLTKV